MRRRHFQYRLGGYACSYQELLVPFTASTAVAGHAVSPYIYAASRLARTSGSAADRVFPDCRGAPAARRPSPLTVGLIEGHGTGGERDPSRDVQIPPRPGTDSQTAGLLTGEPGDPGRSRCRMSARDHPAGRAPTGGRGPRTSRWGRPVRSRVAVAQEGAATRRVRTLAPPLRSVIWEVRENARTPAVLHD
jgi:hypothetical protein